MKKFAKFVAAAAVLAISATAGATPIINTYTPSNNILINRNQPLSWTFDFVPAFGFVVGKDSFDWANLLITLKDNNNLESFSFNLDEILIGGGTDVPDSQQNTNYGPFAITGSSLQNLNDTGKLSVQISTASGNFMFVSSSLTANMIEGEDNSPIPEPVTMALMGLGLFGIAAVRRKA